MAATLPRKPPPQFQTKILAPRWLPHRQALRGELRPAAAMLPTGAVAATAAGDAFASDGATA